MTETPDPYVYPQRGWRPWLRKRRWYERTHRPLNRLRIDRWAAQGGFYVRHPIEGEVLEAMRDGRLEIGEGTHLEPGCWITMAPGARIRIGRGCYLNRETMLAAQESIEIGDHVMFANHCFVGDADHRFDDPDLPVTWQGFTPKGPVTIGDNVWIGKGCVITGGVEIGERAVIGSNSVVTRDVAPRTIAAGAAREGDQTDRVRRRAGGGADRGTLSGASPVAGPR